ncbi:MAG: alkane 1-monooxygenase [Bacteroidetes bacterium]|nr:MAG: alkane 1-monooxygenase [Bacteroidota bacterium]
MLRRFTHFIGYLSAFILPLLFLVSLQYRSYWVGLVPFYALVIIPLLDHLSTPNHNSLKPKEAFPLGFYQFILVAWTIIQTSLLLYALIELNAYPPSSLSEGLFLTWSMGIITGGIGITVAHELVHKKETWAKQAGAFLLSSVAYTHFSIQHIEGHHVLVGTKEDAVTAPRGTSVYRFLVRAIPHAWLQAWDIEKRKLERKQKGVWTYHNRMLRYMAGILLTFGMFLSTAYFVQGFVHPFLFVFMLGQAIVAFSLLEMVEYLEHYGLTRQMKGNRLEPVAYHHSWNSGHRTSNFFLFQLQRHPDHHGDWMKWYPYLESKTESPQLPSGYPAMLVLAAIPSLWFKVMDPILDEYLKGRD